MRITISDVRKAGHCTRGARRWFEDYDLDFRDFLKNGIETEKFLATGDALAALVVEEKIKRETPNG